jgi:hypothetical protein
LKACVRDHAVGLCTDRRASERRISSVPSLLAKNPDYTQNPTGVAA